MRALNAANVASAWRGTVTLCVGTSGNDINAPLQSTVRYLHTDALGSPVAETNETGTVVKRTRYEPYGAPTDGIYLDGPGYTGHVTDEATRLTYMQQRYYDPLAGRFLSLDPVTTDPNTGVGFNRYAYANNNPYRFVDPDGRATTCIDGECTTTADTFNPAKSNGQTTIASPQLKTAAEAGKYQVRVPTGSEEKLGFITAGANGRPRVTTDSDAETTTGDSTAAKAIPKGALAAIHGHIESGPRKANGLVDRPNPKQPLGDSQPLKAGLPSATVYKNTVGWHEIVKGQLQFSYPEGALSESQTEAVQNNLNLEQTYFHR